MDETSDASTIYPQFYTVFTNTNHELINSGFWCHFTAPTIQKRIREQEIRKERLQSNKLNSHTEEENLECKNPVGRGSERHHLSVLSTTLGKAVNTN